MKFVSILGIPIDLVKKKTPGDSKWPFHPLVGGHLTFPKGHLTIPKKVTMNCQVWFSHGFPFIWPYSTLFFLRRCGWGGGRLASWKPQIWPWFWHEIRTSQKPQKGETPGGLIWAVFQGFLLGVKKKHRFSQATTIFIYLQCQVPYFFKATENL